MEPDGSLPYSQATATCPYPVIFTYENLCFLIAFASFQKTTDSFAVSVSPSVRLFFRSERLGSHPSNFHEIGIWVLLEKYLKKIQFN